MQREIVHTVGDSSDEEAKRSTRVERVSTMGTLEGPNSGGEGTASALDASGGGVTEAATFADMRRDFLRGAGSSLILSRVRAVHELKQVVDELARTLGQLREVRDAIEQASQLHASLDQLLAEDLQHANAIVAKHSFSRREDSGLPFTANLETVVDMFMVDMDASSR
jgi:hypothetical protein